MGGTERHVLLKWPSLSRGAPSYFQAIVCYLPVIFPGKDVPGNLAYCLLKKFQAVVCPTAVKGTDALPENQNKTGKLLERDTHGVVCIGQCFQILVVQKVFCT